MARNASCEKPRSFSGCPALGAGGAAAGGGEGAEAAAEPEPSAEPVAKQQRLLGAALVEPATDQLVRDLSTLKLSRERRARMAGTC